MRLPAPLCGLLLAVAALGLPGTPAQAREWALLVGVTRYPQLQGVDLQGPANDVRLMHRSLLRLGVAPAQITTLAESEGPALWPTHARILAQFDHLARAAAPGDWVLLYFSGHGSQLPQTAATRARYVEPDGLDDAFLPRDTHTWNPERKEVQGALLDDEIGQAIAAIQQRGASVWAIFDTCHAADMWRSPPDNGAQPTWRYVSMQQLGIPAQRMKPAAAPPSAVAAAQPGAQRPGGGAGAAWVGFFAAQKNEGAAEEWLPDPENPQRKARFGVFTHALYQQVQNWRGDFASLARALADDYERTRPFPTPQFTGQLQTQPPFAALRQGATLP